jgi:hypothetical protein
MKARGWTLNQHVVSEYSYDGSWHLLDGSLVTYFPKPDGSLAGVEEIVAGVKDWYGSNPDFKKNDKKLRQYMTGNGWKKGPTVLCNAPFYDDNGWLPAATHGWYATMEEYDGSTLFPYESGYSMGYEVNVQLRHGEKHTRNWFNHGLHVNMDGGGNPGCLNQRVGEENLRYTPKYGDVAPGRIGNGTLEYHFPLGDPEFRLAVVGTEGLACKSEDSIATALHVKKGSGSGNFVIRMPSSYVYLGGQLDLKAAVGTSGAIRILFSENNGLDWKELTTIKQSGAQTFDLKPFVFRRYDYRLKFEIQGANTGLDSLNIFHDIQHSQRPLPALLQGDNTLTFSAGPAEGTVTVEGAADVKNQKHQLVFTDFHPESSGLVDGKILLSGASGSISFPIATPGDLTRLRISTSYRARAPKDVWEVRVSFDQGKTFKTVDQLEGPTVGFGKYTVVSDVPPGVKSAVVQFVGTQRNTLMLTNLRISADYREPFGGFQPVKVTYLWDENGLPKQDVRIFKNPTETYHIHCAAKPLMKSLVMELAE